MEEQTRSKKSGTIPYRMDHVETPPAITVVLNWPGLLNRTELSK